MRYIINKEFILQKTGENIVIFDTKKSILHTLNETASFILQGLKREWSEREIKEKLLQQFDSNEEKIKEDIEQYLAELLKKNIILKK